MTGVVIHGQVTEVVTAGNGDTGMSDAELHDIEVQINQALTDMYQAMEVVGLGVGTARERKYTAGKLLNAAKKRMAYRDYTPWVQRAFPTLNQQRASELVRFANGVDSGALPLNGKATMREMLTLVAPPRDAEAPPGENDAAAREAPDPNAIVYVGIAAAEADYRSLVAALRAVDKRDGAWDWGTGRRYLDSALDGLSANEAQKMADVFIRWGERFTSVGNARKGKRAKG